MHNTPTVEIDSDSGFCFGVVTAIEKAEAELDNSGCLYCLGDIVHNSNEVERLCSKGLETIDHDRLKHLTDVKVLLRAHGEPPSTYALAEKNRIRIIDATCPVVLRLQRRIKSAYDAAKDCTDAPLILIYGKEGHAEVNGLVGQTDGTAIVIQSVADLDKIDLSRNILLYSQTTKSLDGFNHIISEIKKRKTTGKFEYFDTICRQVANRMPKLREFSAAHEVVIFVSGRKSSNGKALYEECRKVNPRTYLVSSANEIETSMVEGVVSIGICGATSTPRWLMNDIRESILKLIDNHAV